MLDNMAPQQRIKHLDIDAANGSGDAKAQKSITATTPTNNNNDSDSSGSGNIVNKEFQQQQERNHRYRNRCYFSLACSIGSMSIACGSLLQIPNITDRITLQRGLFLTSLGFIYFVSLTDFCNKYLLETQRGLQFRRKYRLMMSDVLEITNKIVSAIQAFFSFLVGFIVCKSTCSKSFVYASHFLMEAYGWFGTAYFMYDIWSMYKVHTQKIADKLYLMRTKNMPRTPRIRTPKSSLSDGTTGNLGNGNAVCGQLYDKANSDTQKHEIYDYDGACVEIPKDGRWDFLKYVITHPVMMIHHVFIGTFGLLVVTYIRGGGHCIYSYMFMMEFSTPFVSLRSILSTMRLKDSRIYIVNGLVMLGTFFICRVFMWPYVMWRYSIAIDATYWQAMSGLPRGCIISILILFLPQLYWFFLMVKGALKVFYPNKKSKEISPIAITSQHSSSGITALIDLQEKDNNQKDEIAIEENASNYSTNTNMSQSSTVFKTKFKINSE